MKFQDSAVLEVTPSFTGEEFAMWYFKWNLVKDTTLIRHSHTYAHVRTLIAHH